MSSEFDVDSGDLSGEADASSREPNTHQSPSNRANAFGRFVPTDWRKVARFSMMIPLTLIVVIGGAYLLDRELTQQDRTISDNPVNVPFTGNDRLPDNGTESSRNSDFPGAAEVAAASSDDESPPSRTEQREPAPSPPRHGPNSEQAAIIKSLYDRGGKYQEALGELNKAVKEWTKLIDRLETSQDGRRLANSPSDLKPYLAVVDLHWKEREEVDKLSVSFDGMFDRLQDAVHNDKSEFAPSKVFISEFDSIGESIHKRSVQLREDHETVEALLVAVKDVSPSDGTFSQAIAVLRQEKAIERGKRIAAETDRLVEESAQKVAMAATAKIRAADAVEAQKHLNAEAESRAEETRLAKETADQEKARERRRKEAELEREFDAVWPQMKTSLTPFVTDGYAQPSGGYHLSLEGKKGPVSLGKLKGVGALDESFAALERFHLIGSTKTGNDRERGGFPVSDGDIASKQDRLVAIRNLLIKYGELMVKKGLLAP